MESIVEEPNLNCNQACRYRGALTIRYFFPSPKLPTSQLTNANMILNNIHPKTRDFKHHSHHP